MIMLVAEAASEDHLAAPALKWWNKKKMRER
jgi:hypothetical protein